MSRLEVAEESTVERYDERCIEASIFLGWSDLDVVGGKTGDCCFVFEK